MIPGILQIEHYIRALHGSSDDADRQVTVRLERQAILSRQDAPEISLILSESALRREVGDSATMRDQLKHLVTVSRQPKVKIQVLPFNAQTYEPASYAFTILRFDGEETTSNVIYVEEFTDADYLDRPDAVRAYTRLWDRLTAAALGPAESRRLIRSLANETK